MPQKQFSDDSRFHMSWSHPCTKFSVDISTVFACILKVISLLTSGNILRWRMDEINFQNLTFSLGLRFTVWGRWYLAGWHRQKAHLRSVQFPLVSLVCTKTFLYVVCRIPEILPALALPSLETCRIFRTVESTTQTLTRLLPRSCRYAVHIWSYGTFHCFLYAWTCHRPSFRPQSSIFAGI